jgi:hypothetical protein
MVVVASMPDVSPVKRIQLNIKESPSTAGQKFYSQACSTTKIFRNPDSGDTVFLHVLPNKFQNHSLLHVKTTAK